MQHNKQRPPIDPSTIEALCKVIANTEKGLTNAEIERFLADSKIQDVSPGITKWQRLFNAFIHFQNNKGYSNPILIFIEKALHPARFVGKIEQFEDMRHEVNKRLSFIGIELKSDGVYKVVTQANTISEAETRASHFKHKLEVRSVHPEVFKYCKSELLVENYFHSSFEAIKSIAERIRLQTRLTEDGHKLIDKVFSIQLPLIQINDLISESDKSEHNGFATIIKGLFSYIRNPTAHTPKITFVIEEEDALDLMVMVSLIHKRLDKSR